MNLAIDPKHYDAFPWPLDAPSFALLSTDGQHRFALQRWLVPPGSVARDRIRVVTFCGLNPSTADGNEDDPTIRREIAFTRAMGGNVLAKVNLFPLRATDPKVLRIVLAHGTLSDAARTMNAKVVRHAVELARSADGDRVVAAWGALAKGVTAPEDVLQALGSPLLCLGVTKNGSPRHPLYLPKSAAPVRWKAP